jgi:hypothetical protein
MKEYKLPKNISDLRLKHFDSLKENKLEGIETLQDVIEFLSKFTGIPEGELLQVTKTDIVKMFDHVIGLWDGWLPRNHPPKEITIAGITYELCNPEKVSSAWHVDWSIAVKKGIDNDPTLFACLFYIPKAVYGLKDDNGNMVNSIKDRYLDFQLNFPLTTFLECASFFLRSWEKSTRKLTVQKRAQQYVKRSLQRMSGKKAFTH